MARVCLYQMAVLPAMHEVGSSEKLFAVEGRLRLAGGYIESVAACYRMFAASSASSERSPFWSSMCAAMGRFRNLLTT